MLRRIGEGGMAVVYLAAAPNGRQVAVKQLRTHLVPVRRFVERFMDEARLNCELQHPNVARVFEIGDAKAPFIVMEYLDGEPLQHVFSQANKRHGRLDPLLAAYIVRCAADGLHHAHEAKRNGQPMGIVHRDVSPSNIFVTYEGQVKVTDFGIALARDRVAHTYTGEGIMGKLAYMSPEQALAERVDRRSDIFGLGIVLWELTTGQRLFRSDSPAKTIMRLTSGRVPKPSETVGGYPLQLEPIVMRALKAAPTRRYATADELARDLDEFVSERVDEAELAGWMKSEFAVRQASKAALRGRRARSAPVVELDPWMQSIEASGYDTDPAHTTPIPADQIPGSSAEVLRPNFAVMDDSVSDTKELPPPVEDLTPLEEVADGSPLRSSHRPARTAGPSVEIFFQNLVLSRYRASLWMLFGMLIFGFISVPIHPHPEVHWIGYVGMGWLGVGLMALTFLSGPDQQLTRTAYDRIVILALLGLLPMIYFFGAYMPFAGVIGLMLMGYNLSAEPRLGMLVTGIIGGFHTAINALITLGIVPEYGMATIDGDLRAKLANLASISTIYILSYGLGGIFRRRTFQTLVDLQDAARQIAAREALLREARMDLERAAGIGQPGRFTDQRIGSFVLGTVLGRGGMGEIYEASHVETQHPAAIKLLRRPTSNAKRLLARFRREAEIAAALESPHVVRVLEVGGDDAMLPYIAMERLNGADLAQILRRSQAMDLNDVALMVRQVAQGLATAHRAGVTHRDIKPQNLFQCVDGVWKILDFGVARIGGDAPSLTGAGLVGTPSHMAPEQLRERSRVDDRTDIHALCVVIYRALTGRVAFPGGSTAAILVKVMNSLPTRPSSVVGVPSAVDDVLRVGLAKDPNQRFHDVVDLARAFTEATTGHVREDLNKHAARLNEKLPWGSHDAG